MQWRGEGKTSNSELQGYQQRPDGRIGGPIAQYRSGTAGYVKALESRARVPIPVRAKGFDKEVDTTIPLELWMDVFLVLGRQLARRG
jgi:hypothetical protein